MNAPWEAWYVGAVIGVVLLALARAWARPDVAMLGGLAAVMTAGLLTDRLPGPDEAVTGFGSEALVTVGLLFVVAAAITRTGAPPRRVAATRSPDDGGGAQLRLILPVAGLSAFLNNTPVVAMCLDEVRAFARRVGVAPSKLFLPLSYASILGGVCTLVGTSTNLIVDGLRREEGLPSLGMFGFAWVGVPCLLVGVTYLLTVGRWLLPDREDPLGGGDPRSWTAEVRVPAGSPHAGKSIEAAGLRSLPGLFLARIERDGVALPAVEPRRDPPRRRPARLRRRPRSGGRAAGRPRSRAGDRRHAPGLRRRPRGARGGGGCPRLPLRRPGHPRGPLPRGLRRGGACGQPRRAAD